MHIVPDTLGDSLTLQLREYRRDHHHSASHRGPRIELLANGDKNNAFALQFLHHYREVAHVTACTVQAVHNHHFDLVLFNVIHHPLKCRSVYVATGKALVLKHNGFLCLCIAIVQTNILPAQIHLIADTLALSRKLRFS